VSAPFARRPAPKTPGWRLVIPLLALLAAVPARGEPITALCAGCHGPKGVSSDPQVPNIGGQSPTFITYALKAYAAGVWPSDVMAGIARALSDVQIRAAADFYSRQPWVPQQQRVDREKARQGERIHAALCAKCHVEGGRAYDEYEAVLVGQWMPHLRRVLALYRRGERAAEAMMLEKLGKLRAEDIEALVHYYGRGE
jgi:sulfide dehydrogenase cytochrome subunit